MGQALQEKLDKLSAEEINEMINNALNDLSDDEGIQKISLGEVKAMGKSIRAYDIGWVRLMAAKLGRDDKYIYNIMRGNIFNNAARVEFLLKGAELKDELERQVIDARAKASPVPDELDGE